LALPDAYVILRSQACLISAITARNAGRPTHTVAGRLPSI